MIPAVPLDGDGRPVCTQMGPGNTADVGGLILATDRLQRRLRINRVCVVADRGMISAETIAELEARKLLYVLGVHERCDKLVQDVVLADSAPFVPMVLTKPRGEIVCEAKAVEWSPIFCAANCKRCSTLLTPRRATAFATEPCCICPFAQDCASPS
jgi:hypothetical protein